MRDPVRRADKHPNQGASVNIDIQAKVHTYIPDEAQTALNVANVDNRTLRQKRVRRYAHAMSVGEWTLTGEPIIFGTEGRLLDGQHRLAACVLANVPFTTLVVEGISDEAYAQMNRGMPRTLGDVLHHRGVVNASQASATCSLLIAWDAGIATDYSARGVLITEQDVVKCAEAHSETLGDAVRLASQVYNAVGGNKSAYSALMMRLRDAGVDMDRIIDFMTAIQLGASLHPGDPRLAYRNWLARGLKHEQVVHLAMLTRTWNLWVTGKRATKLPTWTRARVMPQPVTSKHAPVMVDENGDDTD